MTKTFCRGQRIEKGPTLGWGRTGSRWGNFLKGTGAEGKGEEDILAPGLEKKGGSVKKTRPGGQPRMMSGMETHLCSQTGTERAKAKG